MARPLSPEKKQAILEAAMDVVGAEGIGAPTAKIARKAGVAEGTLFTYFASKDILLNDLYVTLKTELGASMQKGYPASKPMKDRARHVWRRYIAWGSAAPHKHRALKQLAVAERVTEESREIGRACLGCLSDMLDEAAAGLNAFSPAFAGAVLGALADTTLEFIANEPDRERHYTRVGFEALWRVLGGS